MMKNVRMQSRYWLAGTLLALVGVTVARGAAALGGGWSPHAAAVAGRLLAGAGLFVLTLGVSRRVQRQHDRQ